MEVKEFYEILGAIKFPGIKFVVTNIGNRIAFKVKFSNLNPLTGKIEEWSGRKWSFSPHMTEGEVVQTAFLAIQVAREHEARETFTYKGKPIFHPHYPISKLLEIADVREVRKEPQIPIPSTERNG